MNRRNQLLIALLVAQLVVAVLVLALPQQASSTATRPLLGDLKIEDISALTVREQQDKEIRLVKKDGNWGIARARRLPRTSRSRHELLGESNWH